MLGPAGETAACLKDAEQGTAWDGGRFTHGKVRFESAARRYLVECTMGRISKAMQKANTPKRAIGAHGFKLPPKVEPEKPKDWWERMQDADARRDIGDPRRAFQKGKAYGERQAEAEQRNQDKIARQRDHSIGRTPVPEWAKEHVCHLDTALLGACGEGKRMKWEIWDVIRPNYQEYSAVPPFDQTFRSRHLAWVTCQKCLVKLDEMLAEGRAKLVKERRTLVVELV